MSRKAWEGLVMRRDSGANGTPDLQASKRWYHRAYRLVTPSRALTKAIPTSCRILGVDDSMLNRWTLSTVCSQINHNIKLAIGQKSYKRPSASLCEDHCPSALSDPS